MKVIIYSHYEKTVARLTALGIRLEPYEGNFLIDIDEALFRSLSLQQVSWSSPYSRITITKGTYSSKFSWEAIRLASRELWNHNRKLRVFIPVEPDDGIRYLYEGEQDPTQDGITFEVAPFPKHFWDAVEEDDSPAFKLSYKKDAPFAGVVNDTYIAVEFENHRRIARAIRDKYGYAAWPWKIFD